MNTNTQVVGEEARGATVPVEPLADLTTGVKEAYDDAAGSLLGSECVDCGRKVFPKVNSCFRCRSVAIKHYALPTDGTLYSFTWVHPGREKPAYCIGYVDLADDVRVLARIAGDRESISCDAPVRLRSDGQGSWVFTTGLFPSNKRNDSRGGRSDV